MEAGDNKITIDLPDWCEPLWDASKFKKYILGGRKSGKSWSVHIFALLWILQNPNAVVMCCRFQQASIADSVRGMLVYFIKWLKLEQYFKITEREIHCINGSKIIFTGLWQTRGSERSKFNVRLTIVEEAQYVPMDMIESLEASVIREEDSQIVYVFNPLSVDTPVYVESQKATGNPNFYVRKVNYEENQHLSDRALLDILNFKETNPKRFAHVYEGEPLTSAEGAVFDNFEFANLDHLVSEQKPEMGYGLDFGRKNSPSVIVESCMLDYNGEKAIYISNTRHAYNLPQRHIGSLIWGDYDPVIDQVEWENPMQLPGIMMGERRNQPKQSLQFKCDHDLAAIDEIGRICQVHDPETKYKAHKPADSILKGVTWLQGHKIIICNTHFEWRGELIKRCELAETEIPNYAYDWDDINAGIFSTTKFAKSGDHSIDALRYRYNKHIFAAAKQVKGKAKFRVARRPR